MLHAVLARKLDETTAEPQRLEDALTSTVIGTLAMVGVTRLLAAWLSDAESIDGRSLDVPSHDGEFKYWFWPGLAYAEPDAMLQLGNRLFVIEAKFRSGLSGRHVAVHEDSDESVPDQLQRQWRSVDSSSAVCLSYPSDIRQAIQSCTPAIVLIVDARKMRHAQREFEKSVKLIGDESALYLLTWQQLFRRLDADERQYSQSPLCRDLRAYLTHCGLDAFAGIHRVFPTDIPLVDLGRRLSQYVAVRPTISLRKTMASVAACGPSQLIASMAHLCQLAHPASAFTWKLSLTECRDIGFELLARRLSHFSRHKRLQPTLSFLKETMIPVSRIDISPIRRFAPHRSGETSNDFNLT